MTGNEGKTLMNHMQTDSPRTAEPKITSAVLVIHFADGTAQRFEFYGSEGNRITVQLAAPPPDYDDLIAAHDEPVRQRPGKIEAAIVVMGNDRLFTMDMSGDES